LDRKTTNVVLIVVDTYRHDSLRLFNSDYRFTPRLAERMADWLRFPRCFSSAPWTLPACTSILSGVDAGTHGCFVHGRPYEGPTLAERLSPGFRTLGIANNTNLQEISGLQRGFEEYDYVSDHDAAFRLAEERLANVGSGRPFFLFFHTNIPHDYYKSFTEPYYRSCFPDQGDWFGLERGVTSWAGVPAERRRRIRDLYDGCIHQLDRRLASLIDRLDLDSTIVCFVADHGEGFDYESGRVHHGGRVHDDLIRVPLLFHLPPGVPEGLRDALGRRREFAASTSDIVPTLLELVGRPPPSDVDGVSLVSAPVERSLVSEDRRYLYSPDRNRLNRNRYGKNTTWWSRPRNRLLQGLVLSDFNTKAFVEYPLKLIVNSYLLKSRDTRWMLAPVVRRLAYPGTATGWSGRVMAALELYDLSADPGETRNLLGGPASAGAGSLLRGRLPGFDSMSVLLGGREHRVADLVAT
jgi:arylsulfatase A-like enzyme